MLTPQFASASTGNHYITPGDFAILYDVAPVYVGGVDGTGQKIPRGRLQHIYGEVRFSEWTWGTSGWLTQYTGYELFGSGTRSLLWLLRAIKWRRYSVIKPTTHLFSYTGFSGTSAAAPSMAGVAALLNQKLGAAQGSGNPLIYSLAATSSNVYNDATIASSGVSGCTATIPSICNNSAPSATALTGGLA